jgi:heptosyltransferase-3
MKGILIWHQGAIGDLILSLPAVYSIRRHFCRSPLHLIARSDLSDILRASGVADETSSNERALYADFFSEDGISDRARDFLENFGSAFVFMRGKNKTFMKNIARHISACVHISTVPPDDVRQHVSSFQMKQLRRRGIALSAPPCLDLPRQSAEIDSGGRVITVHPGSGGREKRWGLQRFLDLITILAEEDLFRFFLILGPAEEDMLAECRAFVSEREIRAEVISGEPLSYISAVLKESSLHVGNDSGITHLASALGRPVVAIFGRTDPAVWGPLGQNVMIMKPDRGCSECDGDVKVEDAARLARELLLLSP